MQAILGRWKGQNPDERRTPRRERHLPHTSNGSVGQAPCALPPRQATHFPKDAVNASHALPLWPDVARCDGGISPWALILARCEGDGTQPGKAQGTCPIGANVRKKGSDWVVKAGGRRVCTGTRTRSSCVKKEASNSEMEACG